MTARERGVKRLYVYLLDDPEAVVQFWHLLQPRDTIYSAKDDPTTRRLAPDRVLRRPGTSSRVTHISKTGLPGEVNRVPHSAVSAQNMPLRDIGQ